MMCGRLSVSVQVAWRDAALAVAYFVGCWRGFIHDAGLWRQLNRASTRWFRRIIVNPLLGH
jgi:hypothetical protein